MTWIQTGAEEMVPPSQQDVSGIKDLFDSISFHLKGIVILLAVIIVFMFIWFGTWLGRT